ncbi:Oxidoreductase calI [Paramyrothecium foliicola]|nr:Oxidoreductase calI [Paramyrothecium foliicola]
MADRYVAIHQNPNGPGDARPTALQIINDEQLEGKLAGYNAFITGCSAGIGIETARALHVAGARLYLTARNIEKAKTALGDLANSDRVTLLHLDLDSFASVRTCAEQFLSQCKTLNILVLNAGVMTPPEGRTKDGFETQFGSNHLSHFLLFNLLQPALLAGVTPQRASRVVVLSSVAHRFGEVNFDDVNFEGRYDPMIAYAQSKTANLWTANEIERRYGTQGIHAWSVQPGVVQTDLMRHMSDEQVQGLSEDTAVAKMMKNPQQGAATSVWAATAAVLEGRGGKYLDDCQIIGARESSSDMWAPGYGSHAYDTDKAKKLWEKSIEWVGLK